MLKLSAALLDKIDDAWLADAVLVSRFEISCRHHQKLLSNRDDPAGDLLSMFVLSALQHSRFLVCRWQLRLSEDAQRHIDRKYDQASEQASTSKPGLSTA